MTSELSDYDYELPDHCIAQTPADKRSGSKLFVVGPPEQHVTFKDIASSIPTGALLVINDTRVLRARLFGKKATGGSVELLLLEPYFLPDDVTDERNDNVGEAGQGETWLAMGKSSKALRVGMVITVGSHEAKIVDKRTEDGLLVLAFNCPALELMEEHGQLPLPPYIERQNGPASKDVERYQTTYASELGAVAAPTAGLHFDDAIFADLAANNVEVASLTLHVGMGTFRPVKTEVINDHVMHEERYQLSKGLAASLAEAVEEGRPVVAVGTTVVRALESAARLAGGFEEATAWQKTALFIRPGFHFRAVTHLVTNFHLPKSTLLMMVSAFVGHEKMMAVYRDAIKKQYRFYSYGDAMLLKRRAEAGEETKEERF